MMRRWPYLLAFITLLGFALRFYALGSVPVGFYRDEAFFGYNAFSIMHTGRDMTGNFLPVHLQSFLFSPAGYSYFSIPAIAIFGLNEFSVRFASALFGTASIVLIYFLTEELFKKRQLAYISAFLLAISPWHINLSRVATENILVVFFIILGVLFYLKWVRSEKKWLLIFSFLFFGLTLFLYQAPRAFLPLFIPFLFLFFHPKSWKKQLILPITLFIIVIILPLVLILSSHDLTQRIRMLSIFQNPATQLVLDEQIREDGGNSVLLTRLFHNKAINYAATFSENYLKHFSYEFLFSDKGLPDRYRVPQMGLLYLFELPLIFLGLLKLFHYEKKIAWFIVLWVLLAPFGTALTYDDVPNLQRTLLILPALLIVIGLGLLFTWELLEKTKFLLIFKVLAVIILLYSIAFYLHQYYVHQRNHRPWYRQEGFKQLVYEVSAAQSRFDRVVTTSFESDPAIFFLFYTAYDASAYQKQYAKAPSTHYGSIPFDKYEFSSMDCPLHAEVKVNLLTGEVMQNLTGKKRILYVNGGMCKLIDARVKTVAEIMRGDGTKVFILQEIQ